MQTGLVLMSIGILQFTIIPLVADLNRSHATNPAWPGHARNHLVMQVLTTSAVGVLALYLLWGQRVEQALGICLATMLSAAALGAFFVSTLTSGLYGGQVMPERVGLGRLRIARIEGNMANFSLSFLLILIGRLLLM